MLLAPAEMETCALATATREPAAALLVVEARKMPLPYW
jgi:hypothetical protein